MRQTIIFNDDRTISKDRQNRKNIRLEILASGVPGDCSSFTVNITDAPSALKEQTPGTVTVTLERTSGQPETYTLSLKNGDEHAADWFSQIETVASDAPMEYSEKHFSVCDTLNDITANDDAFQILLHAVYSMSGIKMTRSLAAMMGDKTLLELASSLDSTGIPDNGKKVPENAMQIINAELNKVTKK